jgi:hypothetical protein
MEYFLSTISPGTTDRRELDRLINLVAEDNAIEDTIYHLHRALNTGRIDLERFLRVSHSRFHIT